MKLTDQELLEQLQAARATAGAVGAIIHPDTAKELEAEIGTFDFFMPNRTQRRAMRRSAGPMPSTAKGAAERRKNRRRAARRSTARNRA